MIERHAIGVFDRQSLSFAEVIGWLIKLSNLLFGQVVFCTLQKPCIQSREAVVVAGNLQPDQLDEFFGYRSPGSGRQIELEIAVKQRLRVGETPHG
jgi:hypothetical protein